ncbi:MAG: hypothetical protein RLZZ373_1078 [Pseudomonadota bacterium]|jgi:hypothetical protein
MALVKIPPPPSPQQKVDQGPGVFFSWHEWFTRLWRFVNDLYDLVLAIDTSSSTTQIGGMVPYYVPVDETFEVPVYKQGLFKETIVVDGVLLVNGLLLGVD